MISNTLVAVLAVVSGASALVPRGVCNADNCLRALRATSPKTRLAQAQADCAAYLTVTTTPVETATVYAVDVSLTVPVEEVTTTQTVHDTFTSTIRETPTTTVYTATTTETVDPVRVVTKRAAASAIPAYASPCSGAVRYSSACSCIGAFSATTVTAPASTTTTTISSTSLTTSVATSVVSTSVTIVYDTTTSVTVTDAAATVSTIATETVTRSSTTSQPPAGPTNVLVNDGFEGTDITPWQKFGSSSIPAISSLRARTGSQSGVIPVTTRAIAGMYQAVSIKANTLYKFRIWVRQDTLACNVLYVGCSTGPNNFFTLFTLAGSQAVNTWAQMEVSCIWTPERIQGAGVSVFIPGSCAIGSQIFYDDASLVEA